MTTPAHRLSPAARRAAGFLSTVLAPFIAEQANRDRIADRWASEMDAEGLIGIEPATDTRQVVTVTGGQIDRAISDAVLTTTRVGDPFTDERTVARNAIARLLKFDNAAAPRNVGDWTTITGDTSRQSG
jgi:hypothetical protein